MAIQPFETHQEATEAIGAFLRDHGQTLDPKTAGGLTAFYPSNVPRYIAAAEALYGSRDDFVAAAKDAGLTLCAQLAAFAVDNAWDKLGQTDRGPKMIKACRRRLGETVNQAESNDPASDPAFDLHPPPPPSLLPQETP